MRVCFSDGTHITIHGVLLSGRCPR
jgi:hypothetical protein